MKRVTLISENLALVSLGIIFSQILFAIVSCGPRAQGLTEASLQAVETKDDDSKKRLIRKGLGVAETALAKSALVSLLSWLVIWMTLFTS